VNCLTQLFSEGGKKLQGGYYVNSLWDLGVLPRDVCLQKAAGEFMGRAVLTLTQLFLPPSLGAAAPGQHRSARSLEEVAAPLLSSVPCALSGCFWGKDLSVLHFRLVRREVRWIFP